MIRVLALVTDLMDQSRLRAAVPGIAFARDVDSVDEADVVVIDSARFGTAVAAVRARLPDALLIVYGPHVDDAGLQAASAAGADRALPRSRFFKDPAAAIDGAAPADR
jgi:hypothetical protein